MPSTKLFAGLASILAIAALIAWWIGGPDFDIYLHDGYVVLAKTSVLIFGAFVCAIFSGMYFAVARRAPRPPNQLGGVVSFALVALSFSIWLGVGLLICKGELPNRWQIEALSVAVLCFLLGTGLSAAILGWGLARNLIGAVRAHLLRGR